MRCFGHLLIRAHSQSASTFPHAKAGMMPVRAQIRIFLNVQLGEAAKRGVGTGANQLPDMSFFSRSIESNGYFMLPSGVIVQWGRVTISGTTTAHITYPIPFPTNRLVLTASPVGSGFTVNPATPVFTPGNRFGCDASSWGTSNYGVTWIAIGG
ncbi:gp53-like domain-containing protein [Citrobacter braakii]|uniref:gp53-like domain-containing protein n=1 Tax=Citrobacter braakii TaxID=57706 RepID=UPI00397AD600